MSYANEKALEAVAAVLREFAAGDPSEAEWIVQLKALGLTPTEAHEAANYVTYEAGREAGRARFLGEPERKFDPYCKTRIENAE